MIKITRYIKRLLIILPTFLPLFLQAETIQCKVISVTDGNTMICLDQHKKQIKVKLYQIDAPELEQAYGQKSKEVLTDLISNKEILVKIHGIDKYKQTFGSIIERDWQALQSCEDSMERKAQMSNLKMTWECHLPIYDINLEMIKKGYAWNDPFLEQNHEYQQAELEARKAKLGLWADPHPLAPREWRKNKKKH